MTESIRELILDEIQSRGSIAARDIQETTGLTRQAVNYHIKHLREEGLIQKVGTTRAARYVLAGKGAPPGQRIDRIFENRGLEEHLVFNELDTALNLKNTLNPAAFEITRYTFNELLNNAIEHSGSDRIRIRMEIEPYKSRFEVRDFGVGIFEHIRHHLNLNSEVEAVQDLLKGKTTSDPEHHTGEGIYFSSKACDRITISSHSLTLGFDNINDEVWTEQVRSSKGTHIGATIARRTHRDLTAIFDHFGGEEFDYRFAKTRVRVSLSAGERAGLVSRSEARRLLTGLDKFQHVELDFADVRIIGQGFADEVFRVFQKEHPEISIEYENAEAAVRSMINHVLNT